VWNCAEVEVEQLRPMPAGRPQHSVASDTQLAQQRDMGKLGFDFDCSIAVSVEHNPKVKKSFSKSADGVQTSLVSPA